MTAGGGGASAVVRAAGFPLLLLLHAMIFIRPAEFSPQLLGLPIYEACILACLATAYHLMADQLRPAALGTRPVNACALGMLAAIVLSGLANLDPNHAVDDGLEFFKLLIYFFLLVGIVDTVGRLKGLLSALGLFATVITTVAVLQYHGVIDLPALKFVVTPGDEWGTEEAMIRRLGSTGVFQDPNDMCLMLVLAMVVCAYQVIERRRFYWLAPFALFVHALRLTHSRGGMLGTLAATGVLVLSRFGRKALLPLGVLLPVFLVVAGGRQTSFGEAMNGGTGFSRVELWYDGLLLFVRRPLFGIGSGRYAENMGHVAHNSFINSYVELGMFGGTLFLAAFYLAIRPLVRLGARDVPAALLGDDLRRLRPYVLAITAGYCVGLMSLSCAYTIPTYTVLGLASIYLRLADERLGVPVARINAPLARRLAWLSVAFVVVAQLAVRVLVRFA